jgi:hypothetical protein
MFIFYHYVSEVLHLLVLCVRIMRCLVFTVCDEKNFVIG